MAHRASGQSLCIQPLPGNGRLLHLWCPTSQNGMWGCSKEISTVRGLQPHGEVSPLPLPVIDIGKRSFDPSTPSLLIRLQSGIEHVPTNLSWLSLYEHQLPPFPWRANIVPCMWVMVGSRGYRHQPNSFTRTDMTAISTIYHFHGCLWHGCPHCYLERKQTSKLIDRTIHKPYNSMRSSDGNRCGSCLAGLVVRHSLHAFPPAPWHVANHWGWYFLRTLALTDVCTD